MSIHIIWNLRSEVRLKEKGLSKKQACEYTSLSSFPPPPPPGPFRKRPKLRSPSRKGLKPRGALRDRCIRGLDSKTLDCRLNERMKLYLISGLMKLVRPLATIKYANKPRKKKLIKINDKQKGKEKLIYHIEPKLRDKAINLQLKSKLHDRYSRY